MALRNPCFKDQKLVSFEKSKPWRERERKRKKKKRRRGRRDQANQGMDARILVWNYLDF